MIGRRIHLRPSSSSSSSRNAKSPGAKRQQAVASSVQNDTMRCTSDGRGSIALPPVYTRGDTLYTRKRYYLFLLFCARNNIILYIHTESETLKNVRCGTSKGTADKRTATTATTSPSKFMPRATIIKVITIFLRLGDFAAASATAATLYR